MGERAKSLVQNQSRKSFAWLAVQWRTACLYAALMQRTPPAEQPVDQFALDAVSAAAQANAAFTTSPPICTVYIALP